jgi:hypothetical protein
MKDKKTLNCMKNTVDEFPFARPGPFLNLNTVCLGSQKALF